jgi:hypothetical protein
MQEGTLTAGTRQIVYTLCLTKCTVHVWCIKNQSVIYVFTTANKSQDLTGL